MKITVAEVRKALVAGAALLGQVAASGMLHGNAQTAATAILAVLGVLGVYHVPNRPRG